MNQIGQNQLLKVNVGLRDGQQIDTSVQLVNSSHFAFNAAQLAECQLNVGEFLAKLIVELLFQIGRLYVVDDRCDVGGEGEQGPVFAGDQLWVVQ